MVNRQDENLGKIHELVIDAKDDRLVYEVLFIGGFIGTGNRLFAMPWKAVEFHAGSAICGADEKQRICCMEHFFSLMEDATPLDLSGIDFALEVRE